MLAFKWTFVIESPLSKSPISRSRQTTTSHLPLPSPPPSANIPKPLAGDTPANYLVRLEEAVSRAAIAPIASKTDDDFSKNVLRSYMRGFKFFGDPIDMAVRKLLMVSELPKETQQIDRVLESFASRYHECNPGIFATTDEAYFISFSILMLHTDVFNRNNKNKMQKQDYTKIASGQGVADEVLHCFYDNTTYTPFIRVEDDVDINSERASRSKLRKRFFIKKNTDAAGKPSREPVDPYALILDNKLNALRPSLKDVMDLDDHYTYGGPGASQAYACMYQTFFRYGNLQIISSRSRPAAFSSPETLANPANSLPGVVDIKVAKIGLLWRKDPKKKKTRSPWREWGAILTATQLYLFRNTGWIKNLMHQHVSQSHQGRTSPIVFEPPLETFKPDVLMPIENAVALQDTEYKKHKNALLFVRHGGLEEVFLAESRSELKDWLNKLNYASTFHTAGIRIRSRISCTNDIHDVEVPIDAPLMRQIRAARQQMIGQRISEAGDKLTELGETLERQLRDARHLQLLAPIQNKTREQVILAAGAMAAKIKWTRIEIWRATCHRHVLNADLQDDILHGGKVEVIPSVAKHRIPVIRPSSASNIEQMNPTDRVGLKQKNEGPTLLQPQLTSINRSSMEDMFSTLKTTNSASHHKPMGSWELPPFSFQQGRPSTMPSSSRPSDFRIFSPSVPLTFHMNNPEAIEASDGNTGNESIAAQNLQDLQDVSQHTHLTVPETETAAVSGSEIEQDSIRRMRPDPEHTEARARTTRSLQRTLREPKGTLGHHRSRRGKDSAGSSSLIDQDTGLARTKGSFMVHGRKASVVNLSSEWNIG